jgi:site-specific DNA recombinase
MTRAAVYVRISRDAEGEALGIARQEADARKIAEARGWDVARIFTDNDVTASGKRIRPGWTSLLEAMGEGKVDAVVAYSSSRLYRNLRDLSSFIDIVEERGIEVATVASGDIRVDTADGRMIARILASVDQAEWERASERRRRQLRDKLARGEWTGGWRPFGYRVVNDRLEVNEGEAVLIRDAAQRVLAGESCASVVRSWAGDDVRTPRGKFWTSSNITGLLARDLPGILAETDTERLRALFDSRRTGPRREGTRLLTGLLECSMCGRRMIHRPQAGDRRYICLNRDDPAKPRVEQGIVAVALERYVVAEAGQRHIPRPQALVDIEAPLYAERQRIVAEMDELADSDLPVRMLERRGANLQRELEAIDAELRAKPADTAAESVQMAGWHKFSWADLSSHPGARAWLSTLIERIVVSPATRGVNRLDTSRVVIEWREGVERH